MTVWSHCLRLRCTRNGLQKARHTRRPRTKSSTLFSCCNNLQAMASKRKLSDISSGKGMEIGSNTKPKQNSVKCQDLAPLINKLFPRPASEWTQEEKAELGEFMANRDGFDSADKAAIRKAGLSGAENKLNWFLDQYVIAYQTDPHFKTMIDPWIVICVNVPTAPPAVVQQFATCLQDANAHLGGRRNRVNAQGEPITFGNNTINTILLCNDREAAHRCASYIKGNFNHRNFGTIVVDANYIHYNA